MTPGTRVYDQRTGNAGILQCFFVTRNLGGVIKMASIRWEASGKTKSIKAEYVRKIIGRPRTKRTAVVLTEAQKQHAANVGLSHEDYADAVRGCGGCDKCST